MKTIICLLSSLLISSVVIAHENLERIGQCFVADGKNITKACVISSGNVAGGKYTLLTIGEKEYLIEEPTVNLESQERSISMGSDSDELLEAVDYYRDGKTKKVIKNYKDDSWSCYSQIKGKLDVCYRIR
jgi:hypothetical protein